MSVQLHLGDCLSILPSIPCRSVDAIVTDPPYPEIDRPYGRMTEAEWHAMMRRVVAESRRILKPFGSAVFILQPNSEKVGRMRPWLWEFMAWTCREWNQVQDAWWWNFTQGPTVHCQQRRGLMRPSLKAVVWLGSPDCFRSQDSVLWEPSFSTKSYDLSDRALRLNPSGIHNRIGRACATAIDRDGATPFNVLPVGSDGKDGKIKHVARTPTIVCDWWTRYICPPGGTLCDPFMGSGTTGMSAIKYGCEFVGIEKFAKYYAVAERRIKAAEPEAPLLAACR